MKKLELGCVDSTFSSIFNTNISSLLLVGNDGLTFNNIIIRSFVSLTITNLFDAIPDSDLAYDTGSSFYPYGFNSFRYPRFGPSAYIAYQMKF